jgi:16S rRNA (cytosine1402-N4)-methyltransferase
MQLDQGEKGFSFSKEGPLDMRMDPTSSHLTARDIVNQWSEKELGELLQLYEEPRGRRVAKAICEARRKRKIETTTELADVIAGALGFQGKKRLHPATLTFQALRIHVNRELESLEKGLAKAIERVKSGGRIGVITFHSLEDRIVKNLFKGAARPVAFRLMKREGAPVPQVRLLTKKPLVPSDEETRLNPRARSAKMRFAEKL